MRRLFQIFCVTGILLAGSGTSGAQSGDAVQVIDVSARKYEFTPGEIRLKTGAHAQIRLHPTDKAHGLKLKAILTAKERPDRWG